METRLKERLVGAIVLVAIVVIVVPELLTGPRPDAAGATTQAATGTPVRVVTIEIPDGDAAGSKSAGRAGAASPPAAQASSGGPPTTPPTSTGDAPDIGATRAPGTTTAAASPATGTAPTPVPSGASAARGASGPTAPAPASTASASSAAPPPAEPPASARPAAEPAPSSAPSSVSPPPSAASTPPRSAAPTDPDAAPPRPKPSSSTSGWVVQLGSFASRPNAEKLAGELRGGGYSAFVSEFRGSGRVLYRVRVGPEQDRARADALAARLAREGRKGTVAPHP